jgi:hypothetical protein
MIGVPDSASVTRAAAPASSEQAADKRADPEGNADGVIGMLAQGCVGRPDSIGRLIANAAIDFLAIFKGGSEPLAGFADFFSGHVRSGGHQGARIFGEGAQVVADCFCMFIHNGSRLVLLLVC